MKKNKETATLGEWLKGWLKYSSFKCKECKLEILSAKKYISHINKFHPPQAPKEWICKCRKLKYECKKHEK